MIEFFKCSFLSPSSLVSARDDALRMKHWVKLQKSFFKCSFLSVRKERKEACTLKIIARIFFHFAKTNELTRRTRSNSIRLLTLHCRKFFDAILFMCKHQSIRNEILSFIPVGSGQVASLNHFLDAKFFMSKQNAILLMYDTKNGYTKEEGKRKNDF